jgi:hypothetical protein
MKRLSYASKVVDKILIEVIKFNKDLNILIDFREIRILFKDYFNIRRIYI